MKRISFAMTTAQIRNQTKTVTRRVGWTKLQPGALLQPIVKGRGIKPGESQELIGAPIRVVGVRRERLSEMGDRVPYGIVECHREGFSQHPELMWPSEFVEYFAKGHGCTIDAEITRIEFDYTVTLEAHQRQFEAAHWPHLLRRAGEDFDREPSDVPLLDCLTCPRCGEMTLIPQLARELSTADASAALSRAFEQKIGRVSK